VVNLNLFQFPRAEARRGLKQNAEKSVLLKGTASAVPQVAHVHRGFSRWGTLFAMRQLFQYQLKARPDTPTRRWSAT
jgi:hypothetical protein